MRGKENPTIGFGLNLDTEPISLPDGAYTFALNMAHDEHEGSKLSNVNESGNRQLFSIPLGYYYLGHVALDKNETLLILNKDDGITTLAIHNSIGQLEILVDTDCLGFDQCKQVKGEFKVRNGCDRIVTLYDCNGSDKYINLSNLSLYYTDEYKAWLILNPLGNPQDYLDDTGEYAWDCNKMRLDPNFKYPNISYSTVSTGGILEVGTYQFSLELLDEEFNVLGYTAFTRKINIFDESSNAPYGSIDGAFALEANHTPAEGGVPAVNKSIKISISDIKSPVFYYRVIVLASIIGDGITKKCFRKANYIPVNASTMSYTFTGISVTNGDVEIPISLVNTPKQVYYSSCSQEQVDGRLLRSNINEQVKDWTPFQHAASQIVSGWRERTNSAEVGGNMSALNDGVKGGLYYFQLTSYHRDEVVPFAIVFVFNDGTYSPAFHIPGAPKNQRVYIDDDLSISCKNNQDIVDDGNDDTALSEHSRNNVPSTTDGDLVTENWDTQLISVVPDANYPGTYDDDTEVLQSNVNHIPSEELSGGKVERWKLYNTSIRKPNGSVHPFAYYEAETSYDNIKGCDGLSFWGTDYCGNELAGSKIRYHRFPDCISSMPAYSEGVAIPYSYNTVDLGVLFANIIIPAQYADIIDSYFIVKGESSYDTQTVIDVGYSQFLGLIVDSDKGLVEAYAPIAGVTKSDKFLGCFSPRTLFENTNIPGYIKIEGHARFDTTLADQEEFTNVEKMRTAYPSDYVKYKFRNVNQAFYLQPDTYTSTGGGDIIQNNMFTVPLLVSVLQDSIDVPQTLFDSARLYISFKVWTRPFNNIYNITYHTVKSEYIRGDESRIVYGGDMNIGEMSFRIAFLNKGVSPSAPEGVVMSHIYMCSYINSELRNHGNEAHQTHWRRFFQGGGSATEFIELDAFPDDTDNNYAEDYLIYNHDYDTFVVDNSYFPLPITFDLCSECTSQYPDRIAYSGKSFSEGVGDTWKLTKPNNYIDLNKGKITNMKYDKNILLILTEDVLVSMSPNPQVLNTDAGTAYVGTGDFLSLPPNSYINIDHGFAGNQGRFNAINTPYGWIWCDQKAGKVFQYAGELKEISKSGLYHWFKEFLPSKLYAFLKEQGIEEYACIDNTSSVYGIGLMACYDPLYERYILHKSDYSLAPNATWRGLKIEPEESYQAPVFYDIENGYLVFYTYDYDAERFDVITPNNPLYFRNESFTISYSFQYNAWVSWHSYMPHYMYSNANNMFTAIRSSAYCWIHDKRNFQSFYGNKYECIIELVVKSMYTSDIECVHWYSQAQKWDDDKMQYFDVDYVTFTKLWAYTRSQSTNVHTLNKVNKHTSPFSNIYFSNIVKNVMFTDKNYKASQLRDLSIDTPLQSRDWADIQSLFDTPSNSGQGYIDKVLNAVNIDTNKSQYKLPTIKDKYCYVRLWFDNEEDIKLTINLISNVTSPSIR